MLRLSQICVDAHDPERLGAWWAGVLGWPLRVDADGDAFVTPPPGQGSELLFLAVPDDKVVKNRLHLDFTPDDQQAEVDRVLALGANAGLGISLGDDCVIEAGLYVTGGTKVSTADGQTVKAKDLSGSSNLLFRRNSLSGAVEVVRRDGTGITLNEALHAN